LRMRKHNLAVAFWKHNVAETAKLWSQSHRAPGAHIDCIHLRYSELLMDGPPTAI